MRKLSTDLIKSGSFTGSFSGSVIGTITSASFASTASYLLNSFSLNTGSSYPITSSWSNNSISSSFSNTSISSSYSLTSSNLSPVAQDLIPISNSLYSLGSPTNKWKDLYVSTGSIYIGNVVLSTSGSTLYADVQPIVTLNTASGQIEISGMSASLSASYSNTSSIALNAISSSYSLSGSYVKNADISQTSTSSSYSNTSSVALNAISSSYGLTSSYSFFANDANNSSTSTSASYSSTASVALNALTSSYINVATNAVSSSFASTASISVSSSFATTSSYNLNSISSSYSLTASFAANAGSSLTTGSTYPITASWSNNSISSSYSTFAMSATSATSATSANTSTSASYATVAGSATSANSATSASYSLSSSYSVNSTTAISSSFASTASYNLNSISSSFSTNATTASYVVNSVSSSYALTASYALNAGSGGGGGSSSTSSLIGQTFVPTASVSQLSLTQSVSNNDQILVILDGLVQSRTGSYTVTGSTLNLTENADSGSIIDIRYLAGSAVSSSYALTSSYLSGGSQILTSNKTVAFSSSFTTTQMQTLIDAQPKNLGGKNLTFQFSDGTYILTSMLEFFGFSNGNIYIDGNSSNNTATDAKNVNISGSSNTYVMSVNSNSAYVHIRYIKAVVSTTGYHPVILYTNTTGLIQYCSFTNNPASTSAGTSNGIQAVDNGCIKVNSCYFNYMERYMTADVNGKIASLNNVQGNNSAVAYYAYGGIIHIFNTGLTGVTTYVNTNGGLTIRPSGATVGT